MSVCFVLIFLYSENGSCAMAALCEHIYMKRGARLTKARDYLFCLCRKWLSFDTGFSFPLTRVSPFLRKPHHSSHPLRHKKALFSIISPPPPPPLTAELDPRSEVPAACCYRRAHWKSMSLRSCLEAVEKLSQWQIRSRQLCMCRVACYMEAK